MTRKQITIAVLVVLALATGWILWDTYRSSTAQQRQADETVDGLLDGLDELNP